jgi:two-component system, OmpR family, phosphate regulon response regulator PhoB
MARILIIEDEDDIREVLEYNLRAAGYDVRVASDAATGVNMAREQLPDLVLLDIMLPDASGLDVCRMLKSQPQTRDALVMMVTAKGEEIDRVVGFELGADDYVVKPFSTRELILRVQAVLRRRSSAPPVAGTGEAPIRFGCLVVDRSAHRAWVNDEEIQLTALEFKLLGTLYDRRDRVQSRGSLLEDVWGASAEMATRTVDTHVKRLREKLGKAGDYIETVRGVGYRFLARPPEETAS